MHRFVQHSGGLHISTVVVGELYAWAHRRPDPTQLLSQIDDDLLPDLVLLDYDRVCAKEFGNLRGALQRSGITVGRLDLMIASTALVHDLTLVTHNTRDFENVPGLRLEDWLAD